MIHPGGHVLVLFTWSARPAPRGVVKVDAASPKGTSKLTWNTFRDHTILEYEIPKWDGDTGQPNVYLPTTRALMERKTKLLHNHFRSQRSKDWFDDEIFMGLARLRARECRAPGGFAEAFHARKLMVQ